MADATVRGLVFNTRDMTDRRMLEEQLERRAFFDSLTGLPNRAVFRDRLDHALARAARDRDVLAVLLLDLDRFKFVNDSLGHDAGDELLVAAARRLQVPAGRATRSRGSAGTSSPSCWRTAPSEDERARHGGPSARLRSPSRSRSGGASCSCARRSGSRSASPGESNTDEMIRNADTAMYAAKAAGKARYEFFRPSMHARALELLRGAGRSPAGARSAASSSSTTSRSSTSRPGRR